MRRRGTRSASISALKEGSRTAERVGIVLQFVAAGMAYGGWAAAIPGAKAALGLSDGALGAALLCVAGGAMAAMPVAGALGARGWRALPIGVGLGLAGAVLLPGAVASGWALAGALLLLGAAAGSLDVLMNARASVFEAASGRAVMSSFHAAFSLGGLLGTVVVAASEAGGLGFRGGLGLVAAAVACCTLLQVRLDPAGGALPSGGDGFVRPGAALLSLGVLCLLSFMTEGAVADWSGVFLRDIAGFRAGFGVAAGYAAFSAAMIAGRLFGDRWVRRYGAHRVVAAGAVAAAGGIGLAMLLPAVGAAGFGLVGLGVANIAPVLFSAAGRAVPAASAGIATVATIGYAGMLLGPPVVGGLAEAAGLRLAIGALLVAMLVIAARAGRLPR